ncbi:MAG: hypothetical protein K2L42_01520 [Clostridia bacterium]|nr:hypothetical protein [Clostridia bacterium]
MADNRYEDSIQQGQPLKKADLILRYERELSVKAEEILNQAKQSNADLQTALEQLAEEKKELARVIAKSEEIQNALESDYNALKQELKYLSVQNANIFDSVAEKVGEVKELAQSPNTKREEPAEENAVVENAQPAEIDYDLLADKIAARMPVPQAVEGEPVQYVAPVAQTVEPIDYDVLVDKLIARLPVQEASAAAPVQPAVIDYDYLADKLASRLPAQEAAVASAAPLPVAVSVAEPQIDYDYLAQKVAALIPAGGVAAEVSPSQIDVDYLADKVVSRIPLQEAVSPDYIASRVAEQLVLPQVHAEMEVDYEALADKVAERLTVPAAEADNDYIAERVIEKVNAVAVDNDYIAEKVAERISNGNVDSEYIANKVAEQIVLPETQAIDYDYLVQKIAEQLPAPDVNNSAIVAPVNYDINEDELADAIALKVGSLKPEDFEILVDDEGCNTLAKEVTDKLDYEFIANAVAEKLRTALVEEESGEPDYEEMAARISEKITVAGINEDAIADKAAAVLSNYLPEYDSDEIADKVAEQVISAMPSVDHDVLTESISARLIESQQDNDYEIVLDEDGIDKVSDSVSERVYATAEERFTAIDNEISEIKEMLKNGVVAVRSEEAASSAAYEEPYVVEETLVTVSDLIEENYEEEPEAEEETAEEQPEIVEEETVEETEEVTEEIEEEPETEEAVEEQTEEIIEEPVQETAEEKAEEAPEEEKIPVVLVVGAEDGEDDDDTDGDEEAEEGEESEGGVDFANMMRYNRSFIARIIQSSDEQKKYYGETRNALLSYKKVNSNIAWGAERFHKGRETIARFKIRGKTLVLYLALDPKTHEISVYHHKDVSDNKSLHGTPMMIKIKSPLGVKKAVRLIDEMLEARNGVKRSIPQRDYAAMYPYESMEELIEDGLVKDVKKK